MKDMGRVMGIIRPQIQGRADAGEDSKHLKEALSSKINQCHIDLKTAKLEVKSDYAC